MRRTVGLLCLLVLTWLVPGLCLGTARATGEGEHPTVNVTIHYAEQDGKARPPEKLKDLDLSKPADIQKLRNALDDQAATVELEVIEAPPFLAWDLGVWTVVVFILLYLILRYMPLPGANGKSAWIMMLEGLQMREDNIRKAREDAELARKEAQLLRQELEKRIAAAHEEVRGLLEEARRDAQRAKDELIATGRAEAQAERERVRRDIERARDQALHELWTQTAQLAALVSAKAIGRQITPEDHHRLVDEALAELPHAAGNHQRHV